MKKKANIIIKNNIEEVKETVDVNIKNPNEYSYIEKNNTKVIFNKNNKTLIRNNDEIYMKYIFEENKVTEGTIIVKDLNKTLKIKIRTKYINIKNNNIEIKYELENEEYIYIIDME